MLTGWYPAETFLTFTASQKKTICIDWFSAHSPYILEKLFSREPSGKHCIGPKILFVDEMFGINFFNLYRFWNHVFVIVKMNA